MGSSRSSCKHRGERLSVTRIIQTFVYTWSLSANAITSSPNVRKAPLKNLSIRNIWPTKEFKFLFKSDFTFRVINKTWVKYCPLRGFPQIALPQIVIKSGVFTKLTLRQFANVNVGVGLLNPFLVQYLNSFFCREGTKTRVNIHIINHL